MQTDDNEESPRRGAKPERAAEQKKKPYRTPRLVEYGDLRRLTSGSAGTRGDSTPPGGKSKT